MVASYTQNLERGTGPGNWGQAASGVAALIPEEVSREIMDGVEEKSAAVKLMRHQSMGTAIYRMPCLDALPEAFWINGDAGLIATSKMVWKNKYLNAEPVGVIVPVPKDVLADLDYDLWGLVKPKISEAIARALDLAVFFGVNKPDSWPQAIATAAIAAGNTKTYDSGVAPLKDIFGDISATMGLVEGDGYDVDGFFYHLALKQLFRDARDTTGQPLYQPTDGKKPATIYGIQCFDTPKIGSFQGQSGANQVRLIAGDWSNAMLGIRQDLEFEFLREATLVDASGQATYSLPQQRMVAMLVTARYAFQVANPINAINPTEMSGSLDALGNRTVTTGDRYPFAVLRHSS